MSYIRITFSPTGGTDKTASILAAGIAPGWTCIDLLKSCTETCFTADDICLVSVPSFGGRVPTLAAERLRFFHGNGAKAILLCVYGNRAYEDTLSELQDILSKQGFVCMAAAAAVAEHSILREFGSGRPDAEDAAELGGFAEKITEHLAHIADKPLCVPGSHGTYKPYKNTPFIPAENDGCTHCRICAEACPTEAIGDTPDRIDPERCIKCMRCTAVCPTGSRKLSPDLTGALRERLMPVCTARKTNELFL